MSMSMLVREPSRSHLMPPQVLGSVVAAREDLMFSFYGYLWQAVNIGFTVSHVVSIHRHHCRIFAVVSSEVHGRVRSQGQRGGILHQWAHSFLALSHRPVDRAAVVGDAANRSVAHLGACLFDGDKRHLALPHHRLVSPENIRGHVQYGRGFEQDPDFARWISSLPHRDDDAGTSWYYSRSCVGRVLCCSQGCRASTHKLSPDKLDRLGPRIIRLHFSC